MMDGCLCVRAEMTASTAASHQGTLTAQAEAADVRGFFFFWLNIPAIKKIILSYSYSSISV